MKSITFFFLLVVSLLTVGACSKDEFEYKNDYEKSWQSWQEFKLNSNNSYYYQVDNGTWSGFSWRTIISVDQGQIVKREFYYTVFDGVVRPTDGWTLENAKDMVTSYNEQVSIDNPLTPEELFEMMWWSENKENLGSNTSNLAAKLLLMEEVYHQAKSKWLTKRKDADTFFEMSNNGMISTAGYVIDGCMDDCFYGIKISAIKPLNN